MVDLKVDSVRIVNDGDPFGDAQGYFRVDFYTGRWGDAPLHEVMRAYRSRPPGAGWPSWTTATCSVRAGAFTITDKAFIFTDYRARLGWIREVLAQRQAAAGTA